MFHDYGLNKRLKGQFVKLISVKNGCHLRRTRRNESKSNHASPRLARSSQMSSTSCSGTGTSTATWKLVQGWLPSNGGRGRGVSATRNEAPWVLPNLSGCTALVFSCPSN